MERGQVADRCNADGIARRDMFALGGLMLACAALPARAFASAGMTPAGYVLDTRFAGIGAVAVPPGAWSHAIDGDVTGLWVDRLDRLWRAPGPAIAGLTGADALFVLEHLAWDRQRRVIVRETVPTAQAGQPLIRWLIAARPSSGIRS